MKYLTDIGVDIEGLESLAALELIQAPAMGERSEERRVGKECPV